MKEKDKKNQERLTPCMVAVAPTRERGSEVVSIEDCVNGRRQNLALYAIRSNEVKRETESLLCHLKGRFCKLMPSNTQFIKKAILHYVGSVMKRQNKTHILSAY